MAGLSMLELFRAEAESQTAVLTQGLLELERGSATTHTFEALMRAAHSLKGAAKIVNLPAAVRLAHALEDCFVAAHQGHRPLGQAEVDILLPGVDLLSQLAKRTEATLGAWEQEKREVIEAFLASLGPLRQWPRQPATAAVSAPDHSPASILLESAAPLPSGDSARVPSLALAVPTAEPPERVLRLAAGNLNRLLALAGESLVESRWLRQFADSLQLLKRQHASLAQQLEGLRQALAPELHNERVSFYFQNLGRDTALAQQALVERLGELDLFDRRSAQLSQRLYLEVLRTRMRPFSEGVGQFPRMVRDLARHLGKEVNFEILGENTQVDRDILERLETPLAHLLRNAVDHGCESPEERRKAGKPSACSLRLEARHSAGVLLVTVSDDGAGVHLDRVRAEVVSRQLASPGRARRLTEPDLLEYLFLPGFTLKQSVTEISGRGFGLDVVQNMMKNVRGAIRLTNQAGKGLRVQLQLPLTLSVLRALLVEIGGEPYAIPLNQIARILKLPRASIRVLEGRHSFSMGEQHVRLLAAHQVLECGTPRWEAGDLPVVVLGDRNARFGLVVDRFLGEREVVVQPLDPRLGKIRDISAAALTESGGPILIIDVEDLLRSLDRLAADGRLSHASLSGLLGPPSRPKRVLAVDDSLSVRELERKLLVSRGFVTDVAADGREAWDALRSAPYDLVITDVDMPRLDGIELTALIKKDSLLKSIPVLIVSYKDRPEDRLRGLEAGADYYVAKGDFQDDALLEAVVDLIGEPGT